MAETTLDTLAHEFWEWAMETSPLEATFLGDRRFEDRLPALDRATRDADVERTRAFRARVTALLEDGLEGDEQVSAELLAFELDKGLGEHEHRLDLCLVNQMYGPQVALFQLAQFHPVDAPGRETLLTRLAQTGRWLDEYVEIHREGMAAGVTAPVVVVDRVCEQIRQIVTTPPGECVMLSALGRVDEDRREAFGAALETAVERDVIPAFERLLAFLRDEYRPAARAEPGISSLAGGQQAYAFRIWSHTSLQESAATVHALGHEILGRMQTRMRVIAERAGFGADLEAYNAALRSDPTNLYASREDLVADAERLLAASTAILPRFFGRLPRAACEVRALEPYQEKDAPPAYYYPCPEDGSRPGIFYVNAYDPGSRMRNNMPALAIHEAVPGHHLQIALATEMTGVPTFRKHVGATAYVEGWALYTERLGEEAGLYADDRALYGMLTFQCWRAARLVVDTGIHALGWSRERAIAFCRENVAVTEDEIANEVDRYILWPGQALAYMVGCEHIVALRRRAEQALGEQFSLAGFHDEILRHGAVTLDVLTRVVDRWIIGEGVA